MRIADRTSAAGLADQFGSPLYVYDLAEVERRLSELKGFLPEGSSIFYSLKANPFPPLVRHLRSLGCKFEVCSRRELEIVLETGFPAAEILYTGPGKSGAEVAGALGSGVRWFSCESEAEWVRLCASAQALGIQCQVIFRINPNLSGIHGLSMSGVSSKFGMDEDVFLAGILPSLKETPYCSPAGIHVYYGTQVPGPAALAASFGRVCEIAARIAEAAGFPLRVVDFGGGFPWPYADKSEPPLLGEMPKEIFDPLRAMGITGSGLWFESGRYIAASSGSLVATVIDIKRSKGRDYVILDAGINHLGGMAGLGRLHLPKLAVDQASGDGKSILEADLVGPLCSPLDLLGRAVEVPAPKVGDRLVIPNVGAYGLTASLVAFLSRDIPVEVALLPDGSKESLRMEIEYTPVIERKSE